MAKAEIKPILSVRVSQKLMDRLDQLCERTDLTRSDVVERCLSGGILDQEEFVQFAESDLKGALLSVLMRPSVFKALGLLTFEGGLEMDEKQAQVVKTVREKKRQKRVGGRAGLAT